MIALSRNTVQRMATGARTGALARSRTMHEIAVMAHFMGEQNRETAERFIAHQDYEEYRLLQSRDEHLRSMKMAGIDSAILDEAKKRYDQLREDYGSGILEDYGWTGAAMCPRGKKGKTTFRDIERAADLEGGRPYYQRASKFIHVGSLASSAHIISIDGARTFSVAPSYFGLASPASATLAALGQCTFAFVSLSWNDYGDETPVPEILALTTLIAESHDQFTQTEAGLEARYPQSD